MSNSFFLSDFDFYLPPHLIAQHPLPTRSASRLLHVTPTQCIDRQFTDIIDQFNPGDVLVFNDTRVLKARLFGIKASGGKVEVLIERIDGATTALAQIRASKPPKKGTHLRLENAFDVLVGDRVGEFYILHFTDDAHTLIDAHGHLPLPPYIQHEASPVDEARYQTVYAKTPGAVAAPTAGLHFDQTLLTELKNKGMHCVFITLHVGAGTFQPVRTENLNEHIMHREYYTIPPHTVSVIQKAQQEGREIIAVGTTSLRALEAASQNGSLQKGEANTNLFITPGYTFHTVTKLITNFHLPKSTLLMLVSAFAGYDTIRTAYQHAIQHEYRFFSYGDAMLLSLQR
jgi:S-adenosylmethionine:tRNA ribosyltransferase-isomerase